MRHRSRALIGVGLFSALVSGACASLLGIDEVEYGGQNTEEAGASDRASPTADVDTDADTDAAADVQTFADAIADGAPCDAANCEDPTNCGGRGPCEPGSSCHSGVCDPVEVATGLDDPESLAFDGTRLFFTELGGGAVGAGKVRMCTVASCSTSIQVVRTGITMPVSVRVLSARVFYTFENKVESALIPGGAPSVFDTIPGAFDVGYFAPHYLYTSQLGMRGCIGTGDDGGLSCSVNVLDFDWDAGAPMTALDTATDGVCVARTPSQVWCGTPNGAGAAVATQEPRVRSISVSQSGFACWTNHLDGGGSVRCADRRGAPMVQSLPSSGAAPHTVAVRDNVVFWTEEGSGRIIRFDRGKGALTTLATVPLPRGLALDTSFVYFTSTQPGVASSGRILRVPAW